MGPHPFLTLLVHQTYFRLTQVHTSASEQWSSAHSVHLLAQIGHMQPGHKGSVLLRLEVPLKEVGLLTHLRVKDRTKQLGNDFLFHPEQGI